VCIIGVWRSEVTCDIKTLIYSKGWEDKKKRETDSN